MADISSFPTRATLCSGDDSILASEKGPIQTFTFAAATKCGQVVVYVSGTTGSVTPAVGATTEVVAGVALYDVASGAKGAVAMMGNICKVTNYSTSVAITPGSWLITNDNAVLGTVGALDLTPAGSTDTVYMNVVGVAIEQIAVSSSGLACIIPVPMVVGNSA